MSRLFLITIFSLTVSLTTAWAGSESQENRQTTISKSHPKYEVLQPIQGKPGFYTAPTAWVLDLRGIKPGTEFRHPHTGIIYKLPNDPNLPIYPNRK